MDRNQRRTSAPTMSLRLMIQRVGLGSLRITPLAKEAPPTSPAKADVQADVLFYAVPLEVDVPGKTALIAEALTGMRTRSCIIDGEAVARDDNGLASFERIRYRQHDGDVFLYAFDLIEFNGDDMRRDPLEVRKATLRSMVAKVGLGLRFNEHMEGDGPTVFAHACKMGLEGIVSKRKDSMYRSGRSPDWLKMKN